MARSLDRLVHTLASRSASSPALALAGPEPAPATIDSLARSEAVVRFLERIADAIAPAPADIIGTPEVARRLACTTVWVAEMARTGEIPAACVVVGTGNGKPWKFYREKIERWLEARSHAAGP